VKRVNKGHTQQVKEMEMRIKQTEERLITPGGLALVGRLLKKTALGWQLNRMGNAEAVHKNNSCVIGYMGLLCQGKSGYEDMREMREDPDFYSKALHIESIPSTETVRQRLDMLGIELASSDMLMEESAGMLVSSGVRPTPTFTGHAPLDIDVSVHDNSNTKKEGVERTYKGIDGYAPIHAYIGEEGYFVNTQLREGGCHSQCNGTVGFIEDTIRLAKRLTSHKLLARLDSGNDALDNIKLFIKEDVDFIVKRNIRQESLEDWLEIAKEHGESHSLREGKTVYTGSVLRDRGLNVPVRIVFQVTVRTMLANGQLLIAPDIVVDSWWTSLPNSPDDVIQLYHEHAICEQFHSELKTDIGLERFPSGKFDTNAAILKLAAFCFNILRVIGQRALGGNAALTRREVSRLRLKTVINRLVYIAGHVTSHARRTFLSLGRSNIWRDAFIRLFTALA
jgi:hypothetical protein